MVVFHFKFIPALIVPIISGYFQTKFCLGVQFGSETALNSCLGQVSRGAASSKWWILVSIVLQKTLVMLVHFNMNGSPACHTQNWNGKQTDRQTKFVWIQMIIILLFSSNFISHSLYLQTCIRYLYNQITLHTQTNTLYIFLFSIFYNTIAYKLWYLYDITKLHLASWQKSVVDLKDIFLAQLRAFWMAISDRKTAVHIGSVMLKLGTATLEKVYFKSQIRESEVFPQCISSVSYICVLGYLHELVWHE